MAELKIPFQFASQRPGATSTTTPQPEPNLFQRWDDTIVHEAIREALVNAMIHADFRGQGGIVIERYRDRLEFSNPGTLLIGIEQVLKGGVSECRNKTLQGMFALLGYGEKAGSGIDKIRQGWASQQWRWPIIQEQVKPDRVRLVLPMVSLLPEESLNALRGKLGEELGQLSGREVQALVTAVVEGSVTNLRLQQFSSDHTSDITHMLQDLVAKGLLVKDGYGRWASYRLAERLAGTPDTAVEDSRHKPTTPDISGQGPDIAPEEDRKLQAIRRSNSPKSDWLRFLARNRNGFLPTRSTGRGSFSSFPRPRSPLGSRASKTMMLCSTKPTSAGGRHATTRNRSRAIRGFVTSCCTRSPMP